MPKIEIFLWLTQAPNTSMQISGNIGATMTASGKIAHDKDFFIFFHKRPFFIKK